MSNEELKQLIADKRIFRYEIARTVGVSEYTLSKWFREPLTEQKQRLILAAIERLTEGAKHETFS